VGFWEACFPLHRFRVNEPEAKAPADTLWRSPPRGIPSATATSRPVSLQTVQSCALKPSSAYSPCRMKSYMMLCSETPGARRVCAYLSKSQWLMYWRVPRVRHPPTHVALWYWVSGTHASTHPSVIRPHTRQTWVSDMHPRLWYQPTRVSALMRVSGTECVALVQVSGTLLVSGTRSVSGTSSHGCQTPIRHQPAHTPVGDPPVWVSGTLMRVSGTGCLALMRVGEMRRIVAYHF
jgi:hypothetical protein